MNAIKQHLIALLFPLIVAPLASTIARAALNIHKKVDTLPPAVKQVVVFAISFGLVTISNFVPGFLPADMLDPTLLNADWQVFAAWLAALVWHDNKKKKRAEA